MLAVMTRGCQMKQADVLLTNDGYKALVYGDWPNSFGVTTDPNVSVDRSKAAARPAMARTQLGDPNVSPQPADPNVSASQE